MNQLDRFVVNARYRAAQLKAELIPNPEGYPPSARVILERGFFACYPGLLGLAALTPDEVARAQPGGYHDCIEFALLGSPPRTFDSLAGGSIAAMLFPKKYRLQVTVPVLEPIPARFDQSGRWKHFPPSRRRHMKSWRFAPTDEKLRYAPLSGRKGFPRWAMHPDAGRTRQLGKADVVQEIVIYAQPEDRATGQDSLGRVVDKDDGHISRRTLMTDPQCKLCNDTGVVTARKPGPREIVVTKACACEYRRITALLLKCSLDSEDAPGELRLEDSSDLSYSRISAADETYLEGKKPNPTRVRLIVSSEDGHVVIEDVAVTSHAPSFQQLRDASFNRVSLTTSEARWLLARLPEVLARVNPPPCPSGRPLPDGA